MRSAWRWCMVLGVLLVAGGCTVDFTGPGGDCGDGVITGGETCDDGNSSSGDGCGASCRVEDGWTCSGEPSLCETECGDGVARGPEVCDEDDLRSLTCEQLGLGGGELACEGDCTFDTSGCNLQAVCGNNAVEYPETCDGTNFYGQTCADVGFDVGELSCTSACQLDTSGCAHQATCGDGEAEDPEDCDGADLAGETCETLSLGTGELACGDSCRFDVTGCSGSATCGNTTIEYPEVCDGASMGGGSCLQQGFYGGTIACSTDCLAYDLSGCTGNCGDGTVNGPEICDGAALGGLNCGDYGFYTGALVCQNDCRSVDTSGCSGECGDGIVNGNEDCDGVALGGEDCVGLGLYGGTLTCTGICGFDMSACHILPKVVINEVAQGWPDAIELLNLSAVPVELLGWLLEAHGRDPNGNPDLLNMDLPSYLLGPGDRVLLLDQTNENSLPPTVDLNAGTIQYHQNILWGGDFMGGAAILFDNLDVPLDFVRWVDDGNAPPTGTAWAETPSFLLGQSVNGLSLSRVPDGVDTDTSADWCVADSTGGQPNGACLDASPGATVLITEIDIDTPDRIELYNAGPGDVDLVGWTLYFYDDNGPEVGGTSLPSFVLAVGEYVELVDTAGTNAPFVNGDRIIINNYGWTPPDAGGCGLVDPAGNGRDFVSWGSSASTPWHPDVFTDQPTAADNPNATYTLGRQNLTDTDTAGDWCRQLPSLGAANNPCN